jgi:poly-gamma-glutamate capsule biosynthesis protein CapA/YwtB (metallophosphatase superfamily)
MSTARETRRITVTADHIVDNRPSAKEAWREALAGLLRRQRLGALPGRHEMRGGVWLLLAAAVAAGSLLILRQVKTRATLPAAPPPHPARTAAAPEVTITFVGDIMLASQVGRLAAAGGTASFFSGVSSTLRADDLTIGNLECAVATRGSPAKKKYTFCADPKTLPGLRKGGIDAVTLANNHSMDYGRGALLETMQHLRKENLPWFGAGADAESAAAPVIIRAANQTVALLGASRVLPSGGWSAGDHRPGVATAYDPAALLAAIRAARAKAGLVVVYLHWGTERMMRPHGYQRALARRCIDAGADLVVGSHPHVLQGFEYYRGRLIAYSLGNFVFNNRTRATAMLQTRFKGRTLERAIVIPCCVVQYRPEIIDDGRARIRALSDLEKRSFGVRIGEDGALAPRTVAGRLDG